MILSKRKFFLYLSFVLIWMGVIFGFSAQKSDQSDETSLGVGRIIAEIFVADFDAMPEDEQFELIDGWNTVIRKMAHFCEYAVLGIFVVMLLLQVKISKRKTVMIGILICALYAVTDEVHQYFVPGRACQIRDVCIDSAGAAAGILLVTIIGYTHFKIQSRRKFS